MSGLKTCPRTELNRSSVAANKNVLQLQIDLLEFEAAQALKKMVVQQP